MDHAFADLLEANARYAEAAHVVAETGVARKALAVVTCIDSRINPLAVFGLEPGDAKILRNAGARVTDDVERGLALATAALGVKRIAVVQHTDCKLTAASDADLIAAVGKATGRPVTGFDPLAISDQPRRGGGRRGPPALEPAPAPRHDGRRVPLRPTLRPSEHALRAGRLGLTASAPELRRRPRRRSGRS